VTIIEGGSISGQIIDLQGRFNLNNLYLKDRRDAQAVNRYNVQVKYFERLLAILGIKANVTQAITDWMDQDSDISFPDGAEDQTYEQKSQPYRTSNQPMSSPSELMLVEGISVEIYEKLKPFVCALPENTSININTAPAEIIAALSSQIDLEKATEIIDDRTEVFDTNKEFIDTSKTHAADKNKYELEITPLIGVSSQYFQVQAQVQMGNVTHNLQSNLKRNADSSIEVLSRSPGID
jgi:general secretion pathway protein K